MTNIETIANMVNRMDEQLRGELLKKDGVEQQKKLWENTYIKKQIEKRESGGVFDIRDHIRAMVYSMLTSGSPWKRVLDSTDVETGRIPIVDEIFCQYDVDALLHADPNDLVSDLKGFGTPYLKKQMEALVKVNIDKLRLLDQQDGGIDHYYQQYMEQDKLSRAPGLALVKALSKGEDKFAQMDFALVCEYLRNVGYDFPKPDTHIRRLLGSDVLGLSTSRAVPHAKAFELVIKLSKAAGRKSVAETDYILWSYCATGFGEICTSLNPHCDICVANKVCRKQIGDATNLLKNMYVLHSHYEIKETDSPAEIIRKAAGLSFLAFQRRVFTYAAVDMADRQRAKAEVIELLVSRIPDLLQATDQTMFDDIHHQICEEILGVYEPICSQSYGIAQRWLNETLIHLIVIESSLTTSKLPVLPVRKYFHAPVGKELLPVATSKVKERYANGLNLPIAPVERDNIPDSYEMGYYSQGKTKSFEHWEYTEYMEFQQAVRKKISVKDSGYKDVADWVICTWVEVHQKNG